jgi:Tol biopolymer transport system component
MNRWSISIVSVTLLCLLSMCGVAGRGTTGGEAITPHVRALNVPQRLYLEARWSPDGQLIAAIGWRRISATDVVQSVLILRPDGTLLHELTSFPGQTIGVNINALAWRRDGMLAIAVKLISASDRWVTPEPDRDALFLVDPLDMQRSPQLLRANLAPIESMDWSPDGQRLLITQLQGPPVPSPKQRYDRLSVYELTSNTLSQWQFHDTYLRWPRWSPNGQEVMYMAVTVPGHLAPEDQDLILRSWPNGSPQRVSLAPNCGIFEPVWSPDSQWIVYRELCNNFQGKRVNHLVLASRTQPLNRTEICDGMEVGHADWGLNGQLLALTVGLEENKLIVCNVLPANTRNTYLLNKAG